MADPIEVTKSTWKEPHPQAPKFADKEMGIKFVCVPAKRQGKDTIALLGSYRLPGKFDAVYGSRIPGALQVVVIHQASGQVYHSPAERAHVPPLDTQMQPEPGSNAWGPGAELIHTEGSFNMDLRGQLGLQKEASDYSVFVWLDEIVTAVQTVKVPASAEPSIAAPTPAPATGLQFRKLAVSPAAAGPVTIAVQPDGAIPLEIGPHLVGSLADDLLPAKGSPPAGRPKIILLGLSYLTREFRAASADFPADAVDSRIPQFDMPVKNLVDLTAPSDKGAQKGFLLVCVGKALSNVAVAKP